MERVVMEKCHIGTKARYVYEKSLIWLIPLTSNYKDIIFTKLIIIIVRYSVLKKTISGKHIIVSHKIIVYG